MRRDSGPDGDEVNFPKFTSKLYPGRYRGPADRLVKFPASPNDWNVKNWQVGIKDGKAVFCDCLDFIYNKVHTTTDCEHMNRFTASPESYPEEAPATPTPVPAPVPKEIKMKTPTTEPKITCHHCGEGFASNRAWFLHLGKAHPTCPEYLGDLDSLLWSEMMVSQQAKYRAQYIKDEMAETGCSRAQAALSFEQWLNCEGWTGRDEAVYLHRDRMLGAREEAA